MKVLNQKGSTLWIYLLFGLVLSGNILMILSRQDTHQDMLSRVEAKYKFSSFNSYINSLIKNKNICTEMLAGRQINYYSTFPPFGTGIYAVDLSDLTYKGTKLVELNAYFDKNKTIKPTKLIVQFFTNPNGSVNLFFPAQLRMEIENHGIKTIFSHDITLFVAYEIGMQMKSSAYESYGTVTSNLLAGCSSKITANGASGHTMNDVFCDTTFPQRNCAGSCLYKRVGNLNRVLECI